MCCQRHWTAARVSTLRGCCCGTRSQMHTLLQPCAWARAQRPRESRRARRPAPRARGRAAYAAAPCPRGLRWSPRHDVAHRAHVVIHVVGRRPSARATACPGPTALARERVVLAGELEGVDRLALGLVSHHVDMFGEVLAGLERGTRGGTGGTIRLRSSYADASINADTQPRRNPKRRPAVDQTLEAGIVRESSSQEIQAKFTEGISSG